MRHDFFVVVFSVVCTSVFIATIVAGLQWSATTPADGQALYRCSHTSVSMLWDFTLSTQDLIHDITWTFQGPSRQELIAMYSRGTFVALPAYSHRVQFVPSAGIILGPVTKMDSGNYTVIVTGHDAAGASFERQRTVLLHVSESLMTTDHELHVTQLATPEFSHVTNQLHSVLTCGQFIFPSDPPVSVQWLTPDGQTAASTEYIGGFYRLLLNNPPLPGTYSCSITPLTANFSCSHQGHPLTASVTVDALETRMMLMEARITEKDATIGQLQHQLNTTIGQLQHQLNTTTHELLATTHQFQTILADKDAVIGQLQTRVHTVENAVKYGPTTPAVAFTARFSSSQNLASRAPLVLDDVLLNEGHAYDSTTGRFTAPYNGTYVFAATAAATSDNKYADLYLISDSAAIHGDVFSSWAYLASNGGWQSASLGGALRLQKGDHVWLVAGATSYIREGHLSSFSGYIISVE